MIVKNRTDVLIEADGARAIVRKLIAMDREQPDERILPLQIRVMRVCLFQRGSKLVQFHLDGEHELDLLLEACAP